MNYHLLLRDVVEILFYSSIIYTFCIWLKKDKTKNLLSYFLAYCGITIVSWTCELPSLTLFLFSYAPVILMLFIIMHEKTLQRNAVALRSITPAQPLQENWIDILLSSMLIAMNNNKSISIAIEKNDSLEYFLTAPFFINAHVTKEILDILLFSSSYEEQKIIWVTMHGHIKGINTSWLTSDALFYSCQCDVLVIQSNHVSRTFTIVTRGTQIKHIATQNIKNSIKKEFSQSSCHKKGPHHENNVTETSLSE